MLPATVRCPSVRPSVCPSTDAAAACGGFAAERRAGAEYQLKIDCCRRSHLAANAGSVMLRAEDRGSTETCLLPKKCRKMLINNNFFTVKIAIGS